MKIFKKIKYFITREDKWSQEMYRIEERVNTEVEGIINSKTELEIKSVLEKLKERRSNLFIQPEFTSIVVSISGQILGFGAAGFGLLFGFADKVAQLTDFWKNTLFLLVIFYIDLVIISLITLIWFFFQSRTRYPFLYLRKLGNTLPYFYYETLKRERKPSLWMPILSAKGIFKTNQYYLRDFRKYVTYNFEEDLKLQLKTELQQFYLLITYQGYLDHYEMQLDHIFIYGLFGSFLSILTFYVYIM